VLARECVLYIAQAGVGRSVVDRALEAGACGRVRTTCAECLEPPLRFLLETVETAAAWELVAHGTFLQYA
jgi:hypothetical protein